MPAEELDQQGLPEPLRRLYAFAGRWPHPYRRKERDSILRCQDQLVPPEQMRRLIESGRIEFLVENQGCWRCVTDWTGDDPPVWCSSERGKWKKVSSSLIRFLIAFCLREAVFGARLRRSDQYFESVYRAEPEHVQPLLVDAPYATGSVAAFLYREQILVLTTNSGHTYFGANDADALRFMKSKQGAIETIHFSQPAPARAPEWRSLRLEIKPDGSGELAIHGGDRAAVPAGTFGFGALCARLAEADEAGHPDRDARCILQRHSEQGQSIAAFPRDLEWFGKQLELSCQHATDKSPALQAHFELCLQHLHDRASGVLERRWQTAATPRFLLDQLDSYNKSARQTRLLSAACCRRLHEYLEESDHGYFQILEEQDDEHGRCLDIDPGAEPDLPARQCRYQALIAVRHAGPPRSHEGCEAALECAAKARAFAAGDYPSAAWSAAFSAEQQDQAKIIRDVIPSPFGKRVCLDKSWLSWRDGTIAKLAQAAYEERQLPSGQLDCHRLAILADALEEAGCNEQELLAHLRGPGPHVRGCWALDVLLDNE